jgi:hypothetical protein
MVTFTSHARRKQSVPLNECTNELSQDNLDLEKVARRKEVIYRMEWMLTADVLRDHDQDERRR